MNCFSQVSLHNACKPEVRRFSRLNPQFFTEGNLSLHVIITGPPPLQTIVSTASGGVGGKGEEEEGRVG